MLSIPKRGNIHWRLLDMKKAKPFCDWSCLQVFRIFLLCALIGTSPGAITGQAAVRPLSEYSARFYTTAEGLPQNDVRSIAQTPDGYLWFSTRDGLARFDGIRFTVFRRETTPGIGHDMFGPMLVDHLGRLWIATGDGLSCYDHGTFKRYTEKDGLPYKAVYSLLEDRSGVIWIGTWYGLVRFDGKGFRVLNRSNGLPSNSISALAEDGRGGLWIGTYGGGLAHLVDEHIEVMTEKGGLPSNFVETLLHDRAGRLWVGTLKGSALIGDSGRLKTVEHLPGKSVFFYEDRLGTIWAGTDSTFARLRNTKDAVFELEGGSIRDVQAVFEDRDGSLWIGTSGGGVGRYRAGPFVPYTDREGIAGNNAETIFQDSKGVLWVGTTSGLSRSVGRKFQVIPRHDLGDGVIRSIAEDDNGRLWVATSKGVAQFNGRHWLQLNSRNQIPVDIHVLYRDRSGRMWMGSPEGVTLFDHGQVTKLTQMDGLPSNYVISILEDHKGVIWIGTITGLASFEHGRISTYSTANGLLSNHIQCLYEDSDGALWICTPSGLHRFKDGRFRAFTMKDGMFSDSPLHLLEDDQHRFWLSSYRGIFRVDRNALNAFADGGIAHVHSVAYGIEDGMKSIACGGFGMQPAGWKAENGTLWFPTDRGIVNIDPSHLPLPLPPSTPLVEAVLADGIATSSSNIRPETRRIEFLFTAPTSVQPEAVEYRYRLVGYEDDWQEIGTKRQISFTNLPPGDYWFYVSARRKGGPWTIDEATSSIRILPHFYETSWFFTACGLLVLLTIWMMHSLRVRETERRLNAIMAERSRVAQELHDTLLQSVSGTAMEIQGGLRQINLGASQLGMQQLTIALDHLGKSMADARQAIWDLKSPDFSDLTVDRAVESAAVRLCSGGPILAFKTSGKPNTVPQSVKKQAYRIAVEAVTNAVRHSGCSDIAISVEYKDKSIVVTVADNGCGFDTTLAQSASVSNHWGLAGMQQRAEECDGALSVQSTPGKGTNIVLEVPLI